LHPNETRNLSHLARLGKNSYTGDGLRVEEHERDLSRMLRLSLRTSNDQRSHTKERDKRWEEGTDESDGMQ
jgi:hypothetical protein